MLRRRHLYSTLVSGWMWLADLQYLTPVAQPNALQPCVFGLSSIKGAALCLEASGSKTCTSQKRHCKPRGGNNNNTCNKETSIYALKKGTTHNRHVLAVAAKQALSCFFGGAKEQTNQTGLPPWSGFHPSQKYPA